MQPTIEHWLTQRARTGQQTSAILYLTDRREDSVNVTAIPLKDPAGNVLAVLTVAISRSGMVRGAAAHSRHRLWRRQRRNPARHRLQPVDRRARLASHRELARAAEEVAAGNWDARVPEARPRRSQRAGAQLQSHDRTN